MGKRWEVKDEREREMRERDERERLEKEMRWKKEMRERDGSFVGKLTVSWVCVDNWTEIDYEIINIR